MIGRVNSIPIVSNFYKLTSIFLESHLLTTRDVKAGHDELIVLRYQEKPTSNVVAPASRAFSTSSFTAVARSKITWPEQMRWTTPLSIALIMVQESIRHIYFFGGLNVSRKAAMRRLRLYMRDQQSC